MDLTVEISLMYLSLIPILNLVCYPRFYVTRHERTLPSGTHTVQTRNGLSGGITVEFRERRLSLDKLQVPRGFRMLYLLHHEASHEEVADAIHIMPIFGKVSGKFYGGVHVRPIASFCTCATCGWELTVTEWRGGPPLVVRVREISRL